MNNTYYENTPKDEVAITCSEDLLRHVPSVTFEVPFSGDFPKPKITQSPVTITFLPLTESISLRDPASIENDVVDVVLARESKLFGPSTGVSHESDSDFEHIEGLRTLRETLAVLFRHVECQCECLKTSQGYIERLESELFSNIDLEDRAHERKLRLLKQVGENTVQSQKFLITFHKEGEAMLKLLGRINNEISAAKEREPFIDQELTPEQEARRQKILNMVRNAILGKAIDERKKEREDEAGE